MPAITVNVDGSNKPITLSIAEQRGHLIQTIITIDDAEPVEIDGDVNKHLLATNASLSNSTIVITTTATKGGGSPATDSVVVFTLNGANEPHVDKSTRDFNGAPIVTHNITYDFFLQ